METLILTERDIKGILTMKEVMDAVERAFELHAKGRTQMPAKIYLNFEKGDLRAMPAYLDGKAGIKWVNSHPENPKIGLPTVMAILIYNDPDTGFPLAIMDGTYITNLRTGAASGIASKYLARKDSRVFGFVGCGKQAYTQFLAFREVFDVEFVKAYDISDVNAKRFVEFCKRFDVEAAVCDVRDACNCDVLTTSTPSRKPIVMREWIRNGTHINAIGADAKGKQELDERILLEAKIVVDDIEQAIHGGEINVAISKGILKPSDVYASLGEVIAGIKKGREHENEITVFDSTGLAIQDIATADVVFKKAVEMGLGLRIRIFDF